MDQLTKLVIQDHVRACFTVVFWIQTLEILELHSQLHADGPLVLSYLNFHYSDGVRLENSVDSYVGESVLYACEVGDVADLV